MSRLSQKASLWSAVCQRQIEEEQEKSQGQYKHYGSDLYTQQNASVEYKRLSKVLVTTGLKSTHWDYLYFP